MTQMDSTTIDATTPRLFWRRGFAFLLDLLVAGILAGFLITIVSIATGQDLGAPGIVRVITCEAAPAGHPLVTQVEAVWPLEAGATRVNQLCETSFLGLAPRRSFHSSMVLESNAGDVVTASASRSIGFFIDEADQPLPFWPLPDFTVPVTTLIFAFFVANGRRSPGKAILSLKVVRTSGEKLGWSDALKREALKLAPLLVLSAISIWHWLFDAPISGDVAAWVAQINAVSVAGLLMPTLVIGVIAFAWWFGPFIVWRGQSWHDAIAGTRVEAVLPRPRPKAGTTAL